MDEAKEIWKRLFFVLHNNKQPDDDLPTMWTPFKAGNLQDGDLESAIESIGHLLQDDVRKKLNSLCSANKEGKANLLYSMKEDSLLNDDFWCLLFSAFRDRGCSPIDDTMKICILEGGQMKQMTMAELEDKFASENRDKFKSQTSVPDQMIHEDLIDAHLNVKSQEALLQKSYDMRFSEAKATMLRSLKVNLCVSRENKQHQSQWCARITSLRASMT